MDITDKYISDYYKSKRKQFGYTIQEVASKLGVAKETYYGYEVARRGMPIDVMKQLGDIYGIDYITVLEDAQKVYIMYLRNLK